MGGIGIFVTLALVADRLTSVEHARLPIDLLIVLPALVACLNVIAGIGIVGVVVAVYALLGLRHKRALIASVGTLLAAILVAWIMGYVGSASASGVAFDLGYSAKALTLWKWLFVGLGVRIVAAAWLRRWRADPVAWVLIAFVVGYLAMGFLLRDDFDEHNLYALKFLQGILSVFAFAWLGAIWARAKPHWSETAARELLWWSWRLGGLLLMADVAAVGLTAIRGDATPRSLLLATVGALAVTLAAAALLAWRRRAPTGWRSASAAVLIVVAVGLAAWLPSWMGYGLNRLHVEVTLSSDEVAALRWVRNTSGPDALIATNHHAIEQFRVRPDRSYGYRVIAERPVLLEGWEYGEKLAPSFATVRRDNDVLFHATDPDSARAVVQRYGIQFIVMAPKTDLHITAAPWLRLAAQFGSVKVYRTNAARVGESDQGGPRTTRCVLYPSPDSVPSHSRCVRRQMDHGTNQSSAVAIRPIGTRAAYSCSKSSFRRLSTSASTSV